MAVNPGVSHNQGGSSLKEFGIQRLNGCKITSYQHEHDTPEVLRRGE